MIEGQEEMDLDSLSTDLINSIFMIEESSGLNYTTVSNTRACPKWCLLMEFLDIWIGLGIDSTKE